MKPYTTIILAITLFNYCTLAIASNWESLPETAPAPKDNPGTAEKVELGKMLFFDPRISSTGTISCNSCHNVFLGGEDNRPFSAGVGAQLGGRSAPTVWNSAFSQVQFWDGRAGSLEEQAKGPVTNPIEMGMKSWDEVVARLNQMPGYKIAFKKAFGNKSIITADNAAKAIAAYERTLITPNSPFDQYVKGDKTALTKNQVRGMELFAKVGCQSCHSGAAFNGQAVGASGFYAKFPIYRKNDYVSEYKFLEDGGRYQVSKKMSDKDMYKVPTLRNISLTAPYFHNGSVKTLKEAIKVMGQVQLNKSLSNSEVDDIHAFLMSLEGRFPHQQMPQLPGLNGGTFTP